MMGSTLPLSARSLVPGQKTNIIDILNLDIPSRVHKIHYHNPIEFYRKIKLPSQLNDLYLSIQQKLERENGVVLLKNLYLGKSIIESEKCLIYIGKLLGWPVSQTQSLNFIGHVKDEWDGIKNLITEDIKQEIIYHFTVIEPIGLLCFAFNLLSMVVKRVL